MNFRIFFLAAGLFFAPAMGMFKCCMSRKRAADYHSFDSATPLRAERAEQPQANIIVSTHVKPDFTKMLAIVRALFPRADTPTALNYVKILASGRTQPVPVFTKALIPCELIFGKSIAVRSSVTHNYGSPAVSAAALTAEQWRKIDIALVEEGRDAALAIIMSTGVDVDEADRILVQIGKQPLRARSTPPQAHAERNSDIEKLNQLYSEGSAAKPETRASTARRAPLTAEQLAKIEAALAKNNADDALAIIMSAGIGFEEADRMLAQIGKEPTRTPSMPLRAHAGGSSGIESDQLSRESSAGGSETRASTARRAPLTAEQLTKIEAALTESSVDAALAGIMNAGIEFEEANRMLVQMGKKSVQPLS